MHRPLGPVLCIERVLTTNLGSKINDQLSYRRTGVSVMPQIEHTQPSGAALRESGVPEANSGCLHMRKQSICAGNFPAFQKKKTILLMSSLSAPPFNNTFHLVVFTTSPQRRPSKKRSLTSSFVCAECGANHSSVLRKGPSGPKTLCNKCGLRWVRKECKRREDNQLTIKRKVANRSAESMTLFFRWLFPLS